MNGTTAFLIILLLFVLRFGIPFVISVGICCLANRFTDRSEIEAAHSQ